MIGIVIVDVSNNHYAVHNNPQNAVEFFKIQLSVTAMSSKQFSKWERLLLVWQSGDLPSDQQNHVMLHGTPWA